MAIDKSHYIEDANLSIAWGRALKQVCAGGNEVVPLTVSVTSFDDGVPLEVDAIRSALDEHLANKRLHSCRTVAGTIFPTSMWNKGRPRSELFARYRKALPRIQSSTVQNRRGTYFERLVRGGNPEQYDGNQLEFILNSSATIRRRSILQAATFDPKRDHVAAPRLGFPCMQQVAFSCHGGSKDPQLSVVAFYATQTLVERAYGNYLGLSALGRFMAHELGRRLSRMTCVAGIAMRETSHSVASLERVLAAIDDHV